MSVCRWLTAGKRRADKNFIITQVMAKHGGWYAVYNRGQAAPEEARREWARRLQSLGERELIVLIVDNRARNRLLGKTLPLGKNDISESKEVS